MVQSILYCVEQIVVPDQFPNILKTYAKAVIRTQPYDLLRWSAAYFRCMAMGVLPPVKFRLEKEYRFENVTKGYLKALLGQIGKGYFINRDVLLNRWSGLCLPEEDLLKLLSLCRMLHISEIHWLKLFAVMVGSINENFKNTVNMLCELLTEQPEGGPNPVPMWMFKECYLFIAALDCSELQHFENGYKILNDGTLEEPNQFINPPKICSSQYFKEILLNENSYTFDNSSKIGLENKVLNKICSDMSLLTKESVSNLNSSNVSEISSTFQFLNDKDINKVIGATMDFDSIILLLDEVKGNTLHTYDGPTEITSKNIEHAKKREQELIKQREKQSEECTENTRKFLYEERIEILKEIGAPWSWLHQFASHNCHSKSYNFIETQSIKSDITPAQSSAESFDFERNKFKSAGSGSDTMVSKTSDTSITDVEKMLLSKDSSASTIKDTNQFIENILHDIMNIFSSAASDEKLEISNTSSMVSYLQKEELGVLQRAGESVPNFNTATIINILENAQVDGVVFNNLQELHDYLKQTFIDKKIFDFTLCDDANNDPNSNEVVTKLDSYDNKNSDNIIESDIREKLPDISSASSEQLISDNFKESTDRSESEKSNDIEIIENQDNFIGSGFKQCGIEIDSKIINKPVPEDMILGLVEKPEKTESETTILSEQSHITTTTNTIDDNYSDVSSKVYETSDGVIEESEEQKIRKLKNKNIEPEKIQKTPFNCIIPAMPGIGKTISQKTIEDFLTYLKYRSRDENGMVFPRHFKEDKCPNMFDSFEG